MAVGVCEAISIGGRVDAAGRRSVDEHADALAASRKNMKSSAKMDRRIIEKPLWVIARTS
jgi:hypothetical protein